MAKADLMVDGQIVLTMDESEARQVHEAILSVCGEAIDHLHSPEEITVGLPLLIYRLMGDQ